MVGLAPKWVRLAPNGTKSGTFSDQISVHLARSTDLGLKWARLVPNGTNLGFSKKKSDFSFSKFWFKSDLKKSMICRISG